MNKKINIEEVKKHDNMRDCWIIIEEKVYNPTEFIMNHPGGNEILQCCGTDGTKLFNSRPMGSGTPHSKTARNTLSEYYIGDLD